MRVLIAMQHAGFFRNLEPVVRELDRRGHEIVLLHSTSPAPPESDSPRGRAKARLHRLIHRGIEEARTDLPNLVVDDRPRPAERWHRRLLTGRSVVNRSIYLHQGHPAPERAGQAIERALPPRIQRLVRSRLVRAVLGRPLALRAWRVVERLTPPSKTIVAVLQKHRPDVVLVSPVVWDTVPVEADYIRAARSLGIPTVGHVNSWDNLTSKGTVHVVPDAFVVWNEALAEEAVEIHRVPPKVVQTSGAAYVDGLFAWQPAKTRAGVCREMGCPDDNPYVLYLCTSRTLIASEVELADELADELAARLPDRTPTVVVRPHPMNPYPWDGYARPRVVVHPKLGDGANSAESWREYFEQLSAASCVVGLNTSGFLEAVAVDRPCLTIVGEEFRATHEQTGHFRHLLRADFLELSESVAEVAERVVRILAGADDKAQGRRAFAEWFLRPAGLDRPVAPLLADLIESLERRRSGQRRADARGGKDASLAQAADQALPRG